MAKFTRPSLTPLLLPLILYLLPHLHLLPHHPLPTPTPSTTTTPSLPPLTNPQIALLSTTIIDRLHILSKVTTTPPYTNRPYLTPASTTAQQLISTWSLSANLSSYIDPAGNVIADLSCPSKTPRKKLALASHHDTVPGAGRFDGALGVIAAISVAQVLSSSICKLPFDIRVIAFDDEEGNNRFGTTNLGARAYVGDIQWDKHIADEQMFIKQYKRIYGDDVDPKKELRSARGETPLAYLELHMEQGPVLEKRRKAVGVVDAIAGQTRMRVTLLGVSGHAGTVPMSLRQDALTTAAEGVLAVETVSKGVVGTVGKLEVTPGVGNVVPGKVVLSIDVRSANDALRKREIDRIVRRFEEAGKKRSVKVVTEVLHDVPAVRMSDWMVRLLGGLDDVDGGVVTSGAGHDAQIMAGVTDVGMLFVRCRDGVSHREDEFVSDDDVFRGAKALLSAVLAIAHRFGTDVDALRMLA